MTILLFFDELICVFFNVMWSSSRDEEFYIMWFMTKKWGEFSVIIFIT